MEFKEALLIAEKLGYSQSLENENLFSSPSGSYMVYNTSKERLEDCLIIDNVPFKRVEPLTKRLIERYNAENEDSQMSIEYLTPEQIKEKYGIDYNTTETGY